MSNTNTLSQLQNFFKDLFQFDLADLDFGLYRLFHLKRAEIEAFINEQLPREVDAAFSEIGTTDRENLEKLLKNTAKRIRENLADDAILANGEISEAYASTKLGKEYVKLRQRIQAVQVTEGHKAEVFNHLYAFFSRYYEDGDFIPKRRYGSAETYAVPYNGEEVFFHWANRDQHYVKTAERFRDYAFRVRDLTGEYRVRFTMVAASVPKDNIKGRTRYFFPRPDLADWDAETRTFVLPFEFRLPTPEELETYGTNSKGQKTILQESVPAILEAAKDENLRALLQQDQRTGKQVEAGEEELPLLFKRLRHFCRKNTSDFFIHRDLRGFLTRELDFYVKDQVLHVMDLEADWEARRRVIRVFRRLALKVIDFLANIEDAEKRLFEKKKFVLETDYLVPIQHVPENFWEEILGNEAQIAEWRDWYALDPEKDLFNPEGAINAEFLRTHPTLSVHTRHFDRAFARRVLEALPFDDLDDATDGLLVHGENYQALRLLEERYQNGVQCIYIDPPYNTDASAILYKNDYKHSSWMALFRCRLLLGRNMLRQDGILCVAIDDAEVHRLFFILSELFGDDALLGTVSVRSNPAGRATIKGFSVAHEYALFLAKSGLSIPGHLPKSEHQIARYSEQDKTGRFEWVNFRKHGGLNANRTARPRLFYPIYAKQSGEIRIPEMIWDDAKQEWLAITQPNKDEVVVYPINAKNEEKTWKWGHETAKRKITELCAKLDSSNKIGIYMKSRMSKGTLPRTLWVDKRYSATDYGTNLLAHILGHSNSFSFPKSIYTVEDSLRVGNLGDLDYALDFFAGSGTTGHAVINLNRENGGQRKFILVEMGEYFDTVLLPRIAKVMYSPEWKNGKPKRLPTPEEAERTPRLVKIIRLESYEDTLHNLAAAAEKTFGSARERAIKELAGEEAYLLRYWLELPLAEAETTLRSLNLAHPFQYALQIPTDEGTLVKLVDVAETFNYLYGLRVRRYETWYSPGDGDRQYYAVKASDREGKRRILVLWRDIADYDPEKERAFLEEKLAEMEANGETWDEIWINGDSPTPGVASLDPLFKRLMMESVH